MPKKALPVVLVLLSGFLFSGCSLGKNKANQNTAATPIPTSKSVKIIEKTVKERPFITLTPTSDGHRVKLYISGIGKEVLSLEYELIYFADFEGNKIERGLDTGGRPVMLDGKSDFSKDVLFGSESCTTGTCKYRYDEGVGEGTLTIKFNYAEGVDKFVTPFRLQSAKQAGEGLSSGDGIFMFTPKGKLSGYYLTMATGGLPKSIDNPVSGLPYSVFSSAGVSGTVNFKNDNNNLSIYGYSGKTWNKLETTSNSGSLNASTGSEYTFILAE